MPRPKPFGEPVLIGSHSLAAGLSGAYLFHEGSIGRFDDFGCGRFQSPSGGGNTFLVSGATGYAGGRPCQGGRGVSFDGTGFLTAGNPSQAYKTSTGLTPGWSLMVKFRINTLADRGIVSFEASATGGNPIYLLQCNNTGSVVRCLLGNVAYNTVISTPVVGVWYTVVSTFSVLLTNNVTGTESHYAGQGASYTQVFSGSRTTSNTASLSGLNLYLGSGFGGACNCDVEVLYIWDRELKPHEAISAMVDPYQMWERGPFAAVGKAAAVAGASKFSPEQLAFSPMGGVI